MIVADASAVGTFLIPDEAGPFARFASAICAREAILAPPHWHVEIANLVRKAHRRGRLTDEQAATATAIVEAIAASVSLVPSHPIPLLVTESARLNLTAYDTAYFLTAQSTDSALLTDDGALRRAAIAEGLKVLRP